MKPSAFSRHSSPRNRKAPAWDCPSVGGSSRLMAAICGRAPTQDGVRPFSSRCPSRRQRPHLITHDRRAISVVSRAKAVADGPRKSATAPIRHDKPNRRWPSPPAPFSVFKRSGTGSRRENASKQKLEGDAAAAVPGISGLSINACRGGFACRDAAEPARALTADRRSMRRVAPATAHHSPAMASRSAARHGPGATSAAPHKHRPNTAIAQYRFISFTPGSHTA